MLTIGLKSVGNFAFWALPNIKRYAQHTVHTLLSKQHYVTVCYIIDQASRRENRQEDIATFRLPNQINVITTVVRLQTMDSTFQLAKGPRRFRRIISFFGGKETAEKKVQHNSKVVRCRLFEITFPEILESKFRRYLQHETEPFFLDLSCFHFLFLVCVAFGFENSTVALAAIYSHVPCPAHVEP